MLRLLSSYRVDCCGSDFKLCLFIFSAGNGKAPCFSKETLHIMWESVKRNANLILYMYVHPLHYLQTKLSTITNNLTHSANKFRNSFYGVLVQSVSKSEFYLFNGS